MSGVEGIEPTASLELFPTVVRLYQVPVEVVSADSVADAVLSLQRETGRSTNPSVDEPEFEWMSPPDLLQRPAFAPLLTWGLAACASSLSEAGWRFDTLAITEAWANISLPEGSGHREHSHPNSFLSAVYYARAPEGCGALSLIDPRAPNMLLLERTVHNLENARSVELAPQPGMLVTFPSYLRHTVRAHAGRTDSRISVAWNVLPTGWIGPPTARFHHAGHSSSP